MASLTKEDAPGPSNEKEDDKIECAVCLQACIQPVRLPCSHVFCYLCVKGVTQQNRRCAMCRQGIPANYLDNPDLISMEMPRLAFEGSYQWFYEGRNGWWQYDERTSEEIESAYKNKDKQCEVLIAGFLYTIDFENNVQVRRCDPSRRRKIKRDLMSIQKKGVAGIRLTTAQQASESTLHGSSLSSSSGDSSCLQAKTSNITQASTVDSTGRQCRKNRRRRRKRRIGLDTPVANSVKPSADAKKAKIVKTSSDEVLAGPSVTIENKGVSKVAQKPCSQTAVFNDISGGLMPSNLQPLAPAILIPATCHSGDQSSMGIQSPTVLNVAPPKPVATNLGYPSTPAVVVPNVGHPLTLTATSLVYSSFPSSQVVGERPLLVYLPVLIPQDAQQTVSVLTLPQANGQSVAAYDTTHYTKPLCVPVTSVGAAAEVNKKSG